MFRRWSNLLRLFAMTLALAGAAALVTTDAFARPGSGGSSGSRGSRTFSAPPSTNTAPRAAQPIQRSAQPGTAATATSGSRWTSGIGGLLMGGLIGAGLASLFGAGMGNFLGFIIQMAIFAGIAYLVISFFRNRSAANNGPAMATAAARSGANPQRAGYLDGVTQRTGAAAPAAAAPTAAIEIAGDDYNTFERLLKEIQTSYARQDVSALAQRTTPEMLGYFREELDSNAKRGLSNDLSEPRLLQGDLAEAWREADGEYATVAMRYEIIDAMVNVKSGAVVKGSTTEPEEVTELWTFVRPVRGNAGQWRLSAIQQAA